MKNISVKLTPQTMLSTGTAAKVTKQTAWPKGFARACWALHGQAAVCVTYRNTVLCYNIFKHLQKYENTEV